MTTLHVGTRDAEALIDLLPADKVVVFRDGDSWDEWGEGHAEGEPEHVVIRGVAGHSDSIDFLQDIAWIMSEGPNLLEPMTHLHQAGTLAVISADHEWETQFFVLVDPEARKEIVAACPHPETFPVPSSGRFARVYCKDCHTEFTPTTTEGVRL